MTTSVRVGIIMNGVTGRMGRIQHLARSIAAIRDDGGVDAGDIVIWPDPVLVGRDEGRLRQLAETYGIERCSTDLASCLADEGDAVYFDSQTTALRAPPWQLPSAPASISIARSPPPARAQRRWRLPPWPKKQV